jgi:VIT1/CCC1 family predicted Fe2+/Mn2+ transporter
MTMNTLLWVLQIVLAIKLVSAAYTHGVHPDQTKMQRGRQRLGAMAQPLLTLVALCTFLGGIALVLPAAIGTLTWMIPWAAAFIVLLMLMAVGLHINCRDNPKPWVSFVLCALAAFVAYGRWVLVP